ncbi:hypothetical protein POM88_018452 [Heracleum sosnowskyi]|uniref:PH domain-containing protein n=1 Tax=Heracleum sosnowskyi TaxID=360622 RepID=A0AAD8MYZ9_9APIA|nr:hypothetical protein POM88_018452 [Heracleum sosnowskyi]
MPPVDYEPLFFRCCKEELVNNPWTKNFLKMEIGIVNRKHFALALKGSPSYQSLGSLEHHCRVIGRFRARHQRIIFPSKTYTLLAETEAERIDWVNKIEGVIVSLLNCQLRQLNFGGNEYTNTYSGSHYESRDQKLNRAKNVSRILREIPGNEICAECGAPEPDWAS